MVICWVRCTFANAPSDPIATHCLLLQEIQIGFDFIFLVLAHPYSFGQNPEGCKMVVVVVPEHLFYHVFSCMCVLLTTLVLSIVLIGFTA